jgi:hypothetical protein
MQSLGQTALQACSGLPAHSSHFAGSISKIESPWLIPWLVHSDSHAPQLMHSSVILFAIENTPGGVHSARSAIPDRFSDGTF